MGTIEPVTNDADERLPGINDIPNDAVIDRSTTWVLVVGVIFVAAAIVFLMSVTVVSFFKESLPADARPLIIFIFSACMSMGSGFIGGYAVAEGKLPMLNDKSPLTFGVGGGVAVLIILLGVCSLIYPSKVIQNKDQNQLTTSEQQVNSLRRDIAALRGSFETLGEGNSSALDRVSIDAPRLGDKITGLDSNKMKLGYQIDQYQYGAYAYMMAADAASRKKGFTTKRNEYIDKGMELANKALSQVEKARINYSNDINMKYTAKLIDEIESNNDKERIKYIKVMLMANDALTRGKYSREDVVDALNSIDKTILSQQLEVFPEKDAWISQVINNGGN
ncbi:hypothetical protein [Desulforhopalus sp. 52FAK]